MSDVRQQAGLLLPYVQVQQFQNAADAVHIILGRWRWRRAQRRRMLWVRPWLEKARRFQHGHFHHLMPELLYEDPSSIAYASFWHFSFPSFFLPLFKGMVSNSRTNIQLTKSLFCCANERLQHTVSGVQTPWKRSVCIVSAVKVSWALRELPTRTS